MRPRSVFQPGIPEAKCSLAVNDAAVMFYLELVAALARIRISARPELLDEVLALFVGRQSLEQVPLLRGDDVDHVFVQPLLVIAAERGFFRPAFLHFDGLGLLPVWGRRLLLIGRLGLILRSSIGFVLSISDLARQLEWGGSPKRTGTNKKETQGLKIVWCARCLLRRTDLTYTHRL